MDNFNSEKLYDLLVQNKFERLTAEEQAIVLQAMSLEEFTALQNLNKAVSGLNQSRKDSIEELLLDKLPTPKPTKLFWQSTIPIWQAASILVVTILGQLVLSNSYKKEGGMQTAMIDTVWIEKPIEKRITDTVFVWSTKNKQLKPKQKEDLQIRQIRNRKSETAQSIIKAPGNLGEHRNRLNSLNLAEDSVLLTIGFVRL